MQWKPQSEFFKFLCSVNRDITCTFGHSFIDSTGRLGLLLRFMLRNQRDAAHLVHRHLNCGERIDCGDGRVVLDGTATRSRERRC